MNKVPRKKGYVPNKYTGRSMMMYGGMQRKKAAMGYSVMDENMDRDMKKKMYGGGSKIKYNQGGYASIADMEKKCGSKTQKNKKR